MTSVDPSFPAVRELASKGRVVGGKATHLKIRVPGTDWTIRNAEWTRRLKAEPCVVRRVSEQDDKRQARVLRLVKQLGHERGAEPLTLSLGRYGERGDPDNVTTTEITARRKHMT